MVLILGAYDATYAQLTSAYYDAAYSTFYVLEYVLRGVILGPRFFFSSLLGQQEIVVVLVLLAQILTAADAYNRSDDRQRLQIAHYLTFVCVVLRMYRLTWPVPQMAKQLRTLWTSLSVFAPLFIIVICVIIVFSVIANYCFGDYDLQYDAGLLGTSLEHYTESYNFGTYFNAFFTLLAMATGNEWTEIIDALRRGRSFPEVVGICAFFACFYLLINFLLRVFAVVILARLLDTSGTHSAVANEQISDFQRAWQQVIRSSTIGDRGTSIDATQLRSLLVMLKPPLGVSCARDKRFSVIERTACQLTLLLEHEDRKKLPRLHDLQERLHIHKERRFGFTETLLGLHRLALQNPADEDNDVQVHALQILGRHAHTKALDYTPQAQFSLKRDRAIDILTFARSQLLTFCLDAPRIPRPASSEDPSLLVMRQLQQLQRFDAPFYRAAFVRLVSYVLHTTRQRIFSFGLQTVDAVCVAHMQRAISNELRAARLQLLVCASSKVASEGVSKGARAKAAEEHLRLVLALHGDIQALYRAHVSQVWDANSLRVVRTISLPKQKKQSLQSISAVHIDGACSVFVASAGGVVTEWRRAAHRSSSGNSGAGEGVQLQDEEAYQVADQIEIGGEIRALVTSVDSKYLYVAKERTIVVFKKEGGATGGAAGGAKKKNKQPRFVETVRLSLHKAAINVLSMLSDGFLVSAGDDAQVALWPSNSQVPVRKTTLSSPVFAACAVSIDDRQQLSCERLLDSVLICGLQSGSLQVLALPLRSSSPRATEDWLSATHAVAAPASSSAPKHPPVAVTALAIAYDLLYCGGADGAVTIFAYAFNHRALSQGVLASYRSPVEAFELRRLARIPCHAEAVTALVSCGDMLFSASHDLGLLCWPSPPDTSSSAASFRQEPGKALVLHASRLVCAAACAYALVSCDESGTLCITAPAGCSERLGNSPHNNSNSNNNSVGGLSLADKVRFAFLEHDFGACFAEVRGVAREEEVLLTVLNDAHVAVRLRATSTAPEVFSVQVHVLASVSQGCLVHGVSSNQRSKLRLLGSVRGSGEGSAKDREEDEDGVRPRRRGEVVVPAGRCVVFRLGYRPCGPDTSSEGVAEFLVNEQQVVRVALRGNGVRPQLRLDDRSLLDFGTVDVGESFTRSLRVFNPCSRPLTVCIVDGDLNAASSSAALAPAQTSASSASSFALQRRGISVSPLCLSVAPHHFATFNVTYSPQTETNEAKDSALRCLVEGVPYKLATLRTRAQTRKLAQINPDPRGSVHLRGRAGKEVGGEVELARRGVRGSGGGAAVKFVRPLHWSEVHVSSAFIAAQHLSACGWGLACDDAANTAMLLHLSSGMFLSMPMDLAATEAQNNLISNSDANVAAVSGDPLRLPSVDAVHISFVCAAEEVLSSTGESEETQEEVAHYELWCGDLLLQRGACKGEAEVVLRVRAQDLQSRRFGCFLLELCLFNRSAKQRLKHKPTDANKLLRPSGYESGLLRVSCVSLCRGLVLERCGVDGASARHWRCRETLEVVGIVSSTSFSARGRGSLWVRERFDSAGEDNRALHLTSSAVFGSAVVGVRQWINSHNGKNADATAQCCDVLDLLAEDREHSDDTHSRSSSHRTSSDTQQQLQRHKLYTPVQQQQLQQLRASRGAHLQKKPHYFGAPLLTATAEEVPGQGQHGAAKSGVPRQRVYLHRGAEEMLRLQMPDLPHQSASNSKVIRERRFCRRIIATFHSDALQAQNEEVDDEGSSESEEEDNEVRSVSSASTLPQGGAARKSEEVSEEARRLERLFTADLKRERVLAQNQLTVALDLHTLVPAEEVDEEVLEVVATGYMAPNYLHTRLPVKIVSRAHSLQVCTASKAAEMSSEALQLQTRSALLQRTRMGFYNDVSRKDPHASFACVLRNGSLRLLQQCVEGESEEAREGLELLPLKNCLLMKRLRTSSNARRGSVSWHLFAAEETAVASASSVEEEEEAREEGAAADEGVFEEARQVLRLLPGLDEEALRGGGVQMNVKGLTSVVASAPAFLKRISDVRFVEEVFQGVRSAFVQLSEMPQFEALLHAQPLPTLSVAETRTKHGKHGKHRGGKHGGSKKHKHGSNRHGEELKQAAEEVSEEADEEADEEVEDDSRTQSYLRAYVVLVHVTNRCHERYLQQQVQVDRGQQPDDSAVDPPSLLNLSMRTLQLDTSSNTTASNTPSSNTTASKNNKQSILQTRLQRRKLHLYLTSTPLPGLGTPVSHPLATRLCLSLSADSLDIVSPAVFVSWCLEHTSSHTASPRAPSNATSSLDFAFLLHEQRHLLSQWRAQLLQTLQSPTSSVTASLTARGGARGGGALEETKRRLQLLSATSSHRFAPLSLQLQPADLDFNVKQRLKQPNNPTQILQQMRGEKMLKRRQALQRQVRRP